MTSLSGPPIMELLFVLTFVVTVFWTVARAILSPVDKVAGPLRSKPRFQLSDIAWLFLQLQLVLAFCVGVIGVHDPYFAAFATGSVLGTIVIWTCAVQLISRARIRQPLGRAMVIMILLPGTFGVGVAVSFWFGMLLTRAIGPEFLVASVAWPLSMIGLRQLSKWIVRGCEPLPVASTENPVAKTPSSGSRDQASSS